MNLRIFTAALFLMAGLLTFSSCDKDDEEIREQIENNITKGTWRITNFDDSGTDKTNNFDGWNFTFTEAGVVTASNGVLSYAGIWSVTDGDEDNDVLDDLDFNLGFPQIGTDFDDLNDDWDIFVQNSTKLELTEVAGLETDLLTFTKN